MEDPGEPGVNENSWLDEASIVLRDFSVRVYARHDSSPSGWQSQWIATDVWVAGRTNPLDQHQGAVKQIQDARS